MKRILTKTIANEAVADQVFRLSFEYPDDLPPPTAGQFLTIRVADSYSPLLRRPFAFSGHQVSQGRAEILYERRGPATRLLTAYRPGDELDLIAPVGNSFPTPSKNRQVILAGGGIGMGPVLFQYQRLLSLGIKPLLALGARSASRLPLELLDDSVLISTDDGSTGFHGTILQALESHLAGSNQELCFQLCGPNGMMKNLGTWARGKFPSSEIQVSMEQTMACAVGACMGCVIQVRHDRTYARVCSEGPVFDFDFVVWE